MYFKGAFLYHITIDTKCIGKVIILIQLVVYWAIILAVVLYKKFYKEPKEMLDYYDHKKIPDKSMEDRIEENIIRKRAYDEVSIRCRKMAQNGEVTYFSIEDIDRIVAELKKEEK